MEMEISCIHDIPKVLVLCVLHHQLVSVHTNNEDNDESVNETNCWKHAYGDAWSLSGDLNILDTNLIDQFATHGLISLKRRDDIVDRILGIEKRSSSDIPKNVTPRNIHFYLLSRDFRKTGDKEYKIYCDILRRRPKFEQIGLRLCRLCELGCVELLNGIMLENGSCSCNSSAKTLQTANRSTKETNGVRFSIDSTCKNVFDENKAAILADLSPLPVEVQYVDDDDYDERNPSTSVFSASLVCTRNRILVSLILSVDPDEVDREGLKMAIAHVMEVDPKLVEMSVKRKHSTWILLRLPAQAGFELLSINKNTTKRKQVITSIASAFRSIKRDYVSVEIQVSALQPFQTFFPKDLKTENKALHTQTKRGTLVLLQLPPEAGLELLSIVTRSDRKRHFLNAVSSAVCSLADCVIYRAGKCPVAYHNVFCSHQLVL